LSCVRTAIPQWPSVCPRNERYVAALPPSHPLPLKQRLSTSDLAGAAMTDRCHCEQSAFFGRTATKRHQSAVISESEDWAMALVAAGVGIAIVPEGVARGRADVAVREIDVDVKRQVGLAYSAARSLPGALQSFIVQLKPQRNNARRAKTTSKARCWSVLERSGSRFA
jgi:DNA-binding transcriptional LysR family regulator